ncbi:hypothetical protein JAAARDRAFT_45325 [Jaapia argillacea MUCL 33604]|uniref:Uncharacterized protein n=1 Tax=Jaapia argillacea MUCL 33604 TaxID=933084 RepID=A0A067Q4B8_9AGAM|nr:hypothetical protein JAAARDRAFT_45325 [Jaapia argillacea MUCL 33604]
MTICTTPLLHPTILHRVEITRETTLDTLYTYPFGTIVEYPETSQYGYIGHLFTLDPNNWENPVSNFVYSEGEPKGSKTSGSKGKPLFCRLLKDEDGEMVPCRISHSACQGLKVCPFGDLTISSSPYCRVTREDIEIRLARDRASQCYLGTPIYDLFQKTLALWSAFQDLRCTGPSHEVATYTSEKLARREVRSQLLEQAQRGHAKMSTCNGRLLFQRNEKGRPLVCYDINESSYDIDYLEALFADDCAEIQRAEHIAHQLGFGPLAPCITVANFSSNRVCCPCEHRTDDGELSHGELVPLSCPNRLRVFAPLPEYRHRCLKILVVSHGQHTHLPPSPAKTPLSIQNEIVQLMKTLQYDLPDLTPCRLFRHPSVLSYMQQRLPAILHPTISDLHSSLANRDHLRVYISRAQSESFPHGTGWEGLLHMKAIQDATLLPHQHYIRYITERRSNTLTSHDEDEPESSGQNLRLIICMSAEGSRLLLRSQYLQSDISFKRVVGFREFALGALDRDSRQSLVYCRAYTTHQTAVAHHLIFQTIESIVKVDTGQYLRWHHIHGRHVNDFTGVMLFMGDQHGGQAKGLGIHLRQVAMSVPDRPDFHEPHRVLSSLTEYEHLHRIFRLCNIHTKRNIDGTGTSEPVKRTMRSLNCLKHDDWDGAIQTIMVDGGKPGVGSYPHFVSSFYVHGNTLDWVFETTGIRRSYKRGHISKSVTKNLVRRARQRYNILNQQDDKIRDWNKRLIRAQEALVKATMRFALAEKHGAEGLVNAERSLAQAQDAFEKAVDASAGVVGTGSGRIGIVLPPSRQAHKLFEETVEKGQEGLPIERNTPRISE